MKFTFIHLKNMHNMERLNCTLQWQLKLLPQTGRLTDIHNVLYTSYDDLRKVSKAVKYFKAQCIFRNKHC